MAAAAILVVLWLGLSYVVACRLTHRAAPPFPEPIPPGAWSDLQALRLRTSDGLDIGAWCLDGGAQAPVALLLHAHGSSRTGMLGLMRLWAGMGCNVMSVSLRGHGDSGGELDDFGYSARFDVAAALAEIRRRHPQSPIIIHGISLGSAAAVFAAKDAGLEVRGYILDCPFRDLYTAVRHRTSIYLPPVCDWAAYEGLCVVAPLVLPQPGAISPVDHIQDIAPDTPILLLAGSRDRHAPPKDVEELFHLVEGHARYELRNARHTLLCVDDAAGYEGHLREFLQQVAPEAIVAGHPR